jgi:NTP pyrophosphatase (non-canonical NTP hydrolase)
MQETRQLIQALKAFRDERDWAQFHNAKDLALALSVEASELLELFLWKDANAADREKVQEELADVLAFALLLCEKYEFDVTDIVMKKMQKNAEKYPADKARGSAKKYNELK